MLKNIIAKIKEVLYKMNLISGVKKITDNANIPISEEFYQLIETWRALYAGYHSEFHDIHYHTIAHGRQTRRLSSLNMPKVISQEMASLVFNEKCQISISDPTLAENIEEVFERNCFDKKMQNAIEYSFALGGQAIKAYFDGEIKLSFVTADCFIPTEWSNQGIRGGIFVNETYKESMKYTLLEWHSWDGPTYVIKNILYESKNRADLGVQVALAKLYPNLEDEVRIDGITQPLFVYLKPNTANNIDLTSPLGISLYANSLDILRAIDTAFDSFEREFRLGKKRILVPDYAVKSVVDPVTGNFVRYFDAHDEVYQAMKIDENVTQPIQEMKVELRVEEHIAAINALLSYLAMQTGFSPGSFTFNGVAIKTATEVVSENSKTFRTKQSHETLVEAAIKELVDVVVQLAELYKVFPAPAADYEVTVTFDDSVAEDAGAIVNQQISLVSAGIQSKKRAIMKIFGVPEDEAQNILDEIHSENQTATAGAVDFFGGKGG